MLSGHGKHRHAVKVGLRAPDIGVAASEPRPRLRHGTGALRRPEDGQWAGTTDRTFVQMKGVHLDSTAPVAVV